MTDKLLAWFALLALVVFLTILFAEVPHIDLGVVIATTILLAGWDVVRDPNGRRS